MMAARATTRPRGALLKNRKAWLSRWEASGAVIAELDEPRFVETLKRAERLARELRAHEREARKSAKASSRRPSNGRFRLTA